MSDLVVYCVPRKFTPFMLRDIKVEAKNAPFYVMSSFNESTAKNWMTAPKHQLDPQTFEERLARQQDFQVYHQRILSRIYPKGTRIDSSNYNPIELWISGAHMVSLNFQNPTKEIQINNGWFLRNGGCGYVLKPECLTTDGCKSTHSPFAHWGQNSQFIQKFTFRKSHFSQNSHFENINFHKIHLSEISFFTKFTITKYHFFAKFTFSKSHL